MLEKNVDPAEIILIAQRVQAARRGQMTQQDYPPPGHSISERPFGDVPRDLPLERRLREFDEGLGNQRGSL